jgi:dTDP-glucose 4,6-dehydratase
MKTLLVTGGCGFIGANFIRYLLAQSDFTGAIVNIDALTYAGNPDNLADISEIYPGRYAFERADICDADAMDAMVRKYGVDAVCHFAAESHVDRSILGPGEFIRTNINGTYTLLEVCRKHQDAIRLFYHVSTDEVYGSLGPRGAFTESTAYAPTSPYSASKAASDHLVRAYHRTYGLPVKISNCSNNYGPYQFPEKLIPLMILNAFDGKPLPVYGKGENVRDWLYVTDHCSAIWTIMQHGRVGETYNVGGRCELKNIEAVRKICDIADELAPMKNSASRRTQIRFVEDRPGHDLRYAIDCTKLTTELGWNPQFSFDDGLRKTVRWYLENREWVRRIRTGEYAAWIDAQYGKRLQTGGKFRW